MDFIAQLLPVFRARFGADPARVVRAPGRVNLIGEHTDYNNGFVLPAAIDRAIGLLIGPRPDDELHFYAADVDQTYTGSLASLTKTNTWADYLLGVIDQFHRLGRVVGGLNVVFGGTIPIGAGLSSSAALENAIGFGLNELRGFDLSRLDLLRLSQRAENGFVGANVGIMDMFASMMGQPGQLIRLDCRTLDFTYTPFPADAIQIVLCDSRVKHSLASSEYNTRRAECEAGVRLIQQTHPAVQSLRDVTLSMLDTVLRPAEPLLYRRCRYVLDENARLLAGVADLDRDDIRAFGQRMYGSHAGLSRDYEVSCPELDSLVELARPLPGVLGARMMGGGFGGCTINLVENDAVPAFTATMTDQYRTRTGLDTEIHVCRIMGGTGLVA
jgi:galactokinase